MLYAEFVVECLLLLLHIPADNAAMEAANMPHAETAPLIRYSGRGRRETKPKVHVCRLLHTPSSVNVGLSMRYEIWPPMGLIPDTQNCGCACARNAGNVFPATDFQGNRYLAPPACITARALRMCRDAWSLTPPDDRENVSGIPGASATRNFAYLVVGTLAGVVGSVIGGLKYRLEDT